MAGAPTPIEIGQVLAGKYRIDRVLGQGGMGVVVAATHMHLDQKVAIKFLLPDALANADVVMRFQREARAAVKIQSEHVARVIDVGALENGAPYMVMEYLEGIDLAQRIAEQRALPVDEVVRFLLEACEALAEAHNAGIVHRDLKPANLFLAKRADKTAAVKVLDFGISKQSLGAGGGMTGTQAVMGSPYYMSPEQLMSAKHVDNRADIWSLGIVLYESLVGMPPYMGDTMPEIVAQILSAPAPSVRAHRPDVPPEVDAIVARCLAKDPNARYRDVGELASALAPLTHDGARSMDRISRVLGASVRPPSASISGALPAQAPAVTADARGGTVALRSSGGAISSPAEEAWGATRAGLPKRSNALVFVLLGGGALLLAGIVLVVVAMSGVSKYKDAAKQRAAETVATAEATTVAPTVLVAPIDTLAPAATTATPVAVDTTPSHTDAVPVKPGAKGIKPATSSKPGAVAVVAPPPPPTQQPPPPPPPTQTSQGSLHMGIK
jgi:serine/threonine protein kinase